jgi:hypothetical protein
MGGATFLFGHGFAHRGMSVSARPMGQPAARERKELVYMGKVGTGLSASQSETSSIPRAPKSITLN